MDNYDIQPKELTGLNKAGDNLLVRIRKYSFHYLIVIPGLLLIFIFKIVPFISQLHYSFSDSSILDGLGGGSSAGLDNYRNFFTGPVFKTILMNTVAIKLEYILIMALLSVIIAFAVSQVRLGWLRGFFTTLFMAPCFIPAAVLAYVFIMFLSPSDSNASILTDPLLSRIPIIAAEILRNCGIPVFIAVSAVYYNKPSDSGMTGLNKFTTIIKAVSAFSLVQLTALLSWNFDSIYLFLNPKVYEANDIIDTYVYRASLLEMDIGTSAAASNIRFLIQLVLTVAVYFLLKGFLKKNLFLREQKPAVFPSTSRVSSLAGLIAAIIFSMIFIAPLYFIFIYPFTSGTAMITRMTGFLQYVNFGTAFLVYAAITLFAVIVNAFISVTLAYPLTVRDLPGRNLYIVLLLLVMNMGGYSTAEYILFLHLGMVDTFIPYIINGFFTVINIFVLKESFNSRFGALKEEQYGLGSSERSMFFKLFIPKTWKILLGLMVLQFAVMWNTYIISMIYTGTAKNQSPVMLFSELISAMGTMPQGERLAMIPAALGFGLLVSLPPLIVFILCRRLLTSDAFISRAR